MSYITFDQTRPYDLVLLGRVAVDFNPVDYFQPLEECTTFKKYVGGSPANIAVGAARHGMKIGFFARVSDDQLGDFVVHFFEKEGIDNLQCFFTPYIDNYNRPAVPYTKLGVLKFRDEEFAKTSTKKIKR